jgi:hypothetical protein
VEDEVTLKPPPTWLWAWIALAFLLVFFYFTFHAFPAEYPPGLFENSLVQPMCDYEGQCYGNGKTPVPKASPYPFDPRSTTRKDCDTTGCPPVGTPTHGPEAAPEVLPPPPELAAPAPLYSAPPAPEAAYRPPQGQNPACYGIAHRLFASMAEVFAAHRLCDWGAR